MIKQTPEEKTLLAKKMISIIIPTKNEPYINLLIEVDKSDEPPKLR